VLRVPSSAKAADSADAESVRAVRWLARAVSWLGVVALFALGWRYMDLLGDSFWSVATGRFIIEHRSLPKTDPFSFTARGPWLVHMPLSQLLFGYVAGKFGLLGLELFGTLIFCAALCLLWLPHARSSLARSATVSVLVLSIFVQADDLCVRGQVFGDLAFALLLLCLFRLRDGQRVHAAFAVLLGSLWINLHSSAFLSVVVPLAFALALRFESPSRRAPLHPYLVFAGCSALGLLLNPYGWRLVVDLLYLLTSSTTRHIDLFLPPDFSDPSTLLAFAWCALLAALCVFRPNAAAGRAEAALLVAWLVAAATGRRYLPLALGFSAVLTARRATVMGSTLGRTAGIRALDFVFSVAAAAAAFFGLSTDKDPFRDVPLEEARLVENLGLPDHVANIYHWGGFLDYEWNGRRKTFVDGRNQLFEHGAFEAESRLAHLDGWAETLDQYRINTVLWERSSALDSALAKDDAWTLVRRGRIAVVYVRRHPI
jgi:hypothetical protein